MVRLSWSRVKIPSRISTYIENSLMTERAIVASSARPMEKTMAKRKPNVHDWMLL